MFDATRQMTLNINERFTYREVDVHISDMCI